MLRPSVLILSAFAVLGACAAQAQSAARFDVSKLENGADPSADGFRPALAYSSFGDAGRADAAALPEVHASKPESELIVEGLASYGHYKIFASGSDCKLYTAGVEYDRHSWGRLLKARVDYVAEFLPVVLLRAPITQDIWGTPTSPDHHILPGVGFSPIGFRMLWRDKRMVKPYLEAKGGMLVFTHKALSQEGTYENFSLQSATGLNVNVSDKWGVRLGLFSDFHFSNDFIVPVNPGIDVMNANLGVVYHFGQRQQ